MNMITQKADYIGFNATDVITYLSKTAVGKATRRYFLLHGLPGTGKTTLIDVLEHEEGITMRRSNASDSRKIGDISAGDYTSSGLTNDRVCIVLDECDALPKATWKRIEVMSKLNLHQPIILIANDISKIPDKIKKNCHKKELKINRFSLLAFARRENKEENLKLTESQIDEYVDRCQSYRCLKNLLKYGYNDEMEVPQTQNQQILSAMHGDYTEFKTGDLRSIITVYHDNIKNTELVSQADIWLNRYEHGYKYGKYIVIAILNSIRNKKSKLEYPRTYSLIYKARNGDKTDTKSEKPKKKMPNIAVVGLK